MSAVPAKIKAMTSLPAPTNATEIYSFLQMCQYNAMFMFDSEESYKDITAQLRTLTKRDAVFEWSPEHQTTF